MKKRYMLTAVLLFCIFGFVAVTDAAERRTIRVGDYWAIVMNNTFMGEGSVPDHGQMAHTNHLRWPIPAFQNWGWYMGEADWTDSSGTVWPVKLTGAAPVTANELEVTMPVPLENGDYISRYYRQQPPSITVDGVPLQAPMLTGDYVDASKIPGTADVMVEAKINTDLGVTIHHRVLAWDEKRHDNYVIREWTFTNTGNVDTDEEIELPDQTLDDLYYLQAARMELWNSDYWYSGRGEYEEDSLRARYAYPGDTPGGEDMTGNTTQQGWLEPQPGWLWNTHTVGSAMLHVDTSPTDPTDNFDQPAMTGTENSDLLWIRNDPSSTGPQAWEQVYRVMSEGWAWRGNVPELTDANNPYPDKTIRPGHHSVRMEDLGVMRGVKYIDNFEWTTYGASYFWAIGPYVLEPGQSFKIIYAKGYGALDPLKTWEVGEAWDNGNAEPPPGMTWNDAESRGEVDNMPPPYDAFPEIYKNDRNNWAKDAWVFSSIDSFLQNMHNAQWNARNDYNVPSAPPAPSIEVQSLPDKIRISWGDESESASDFAGYRLYRSEGHYYEGYIYDTRTKEHGEWEMIAEFEGSGTYSYDDTEVDRGVAYYYYVSAYDDGSDPPGVTGKSEVHESGKWMNVTTQPAHLTRSPGDELKDIRVVPNPYNISARTLQFPGEPDKIMFMNLPPYCKIRIFTESGDLVKTILHNDGSGDEPWGRNTSRHMTSSSDQIVVSGIYIAHIEELDAEENPTGNSIYKKFVIVR